MHKKHLTKEKLIGLIEFLPHGVFILEDHLFVYTNKILAELLGFEQTEIINKPFLSFFAEDDHQQIFGMNQDLLKGGEIPDTHQVRMLSNELEHIDVQIKVEFYEDESGTKTTFGTVEDLRASVKNTSDLVQSRVDVKPVLDKTPDVFYRTNMLGVITLISPSVKTVLDYDPEEMVGKSIVDFYWDLSDQEAVFQTPYHGKGKGVDVEACLKHRDGTSRWVLMNACAHFNGKGEVVGVECLVKDISDQKKVEDELFNRSNYDDLTQVYNRRAFYREASKQIVVAQRYHRDSSLMMLDLDLFKELNENYGHHAGDEVLRHFSQLCISTHRKCDFVGRLGGATFAIFLPETSFKQAFLLADRICSYLRTNVAVVEGNSIKYSASIGVASLSKGVSLLTHETKSIDDLIYNADSALYEAKDAGGDVVRSYGFNGYHF